MIRIIDYGLGNIHAFITLYKQLGIPAERAKSADELNGSSKLILPGVGAFDHAMQLLNNSGMRPTLEDLVLNIKVPILGVCVGMQILGTNSDEGKLQGLNWLPGQIKSFATNHRSESLASPHMGWNDVKFSNGENILGQSYDSDPRFYFLHSYYFEPDNKANVSAISSYGFDFAAAVSNENIHGVQFHPEKSHQWGAQLLKNFAEL